MNKLYKIYVSSELRFELSSNIIIGYCQANNLNLTICRNAGIFNGHLERVNFVLEYIGNDQDRTELLKFMLYLKKEFKQDCVLFTCINLQDAELI